MERKCISTSSVRTKVCNNWCINCDTYAHSTVNSQQSITTHWHVEGSRKLYEFKPTASRQHQTAPLELALELHQPIASNDFSTCAPFLQCSNHVLQLVCRHSTRQLIIIIHFTTHNSLTSTLDLLQQQADLIQCPPATAICPVEQPL